MNKSDKEKIIEMLKPDTIIQNGPFPEHVKIIVVLPMGDSVKIVAKGLDTNNTYDPILPVSSLSSLHILQSDILFNGDSNKFRLGVEALRLKFAYEYDPYFSLSIARVDPLPHQLEAVYDYFLKLPQIRFLLADDPGAGKTIMAGLLLKELKIRGVVHRTLILSPANLTFQWQREMKEKFREDFYVVRGEVLRSTYGSNPFQERNQIITSVPWVSRIEDANESLLRSQWDLVIVDEAHKMSAYSSDKKTLAYQLGEQISQRTDHLLLMTATPHKGDPVNFCLFLELLDKDVYGDVSSLKEAMKRNSAPFYLRRIKEALVKFPDPETGIIEKIFTKRDVQTIDFKIDDVEFDFYNELTRYVEEQSSKAKQEDNIRSRALTFTMAMLQRRFASSIYACRRSLERMCDKRKKILENPEAYHDEQIINKLPEDFEELEDEERQVIIGKLEEVVVNINPDALNGEINELQKLIKRAKQLEERDKLPNNQEAEAKLRKLKEVITKHGIFKNPKMKLLIFTEHKDTLDYLTQRLTEWGLSLTQIHGGMKIGNRDQPGTRLNAEITFRDDAQILVATEAAGEGINLQFCWFMINYDIPWNPVRLEQRMGRIHRYGQEHDCLILNFVSTNTREGRVLQKLLERLQEIKIELGSDRVFDVVGEVFPSNLLERLVRDMYAGNTSESAIQKRIVTDIDPNKFRAITDSALECLAKREINLSALIGKRAEAKERRLVPEIIEDFFIQSSAIIGIKPTIIRGQTHFYKLGKIPRTLFPIGERLEPSFGRLGKQYNQIVFDKELLKKDPATEWVTPGHPLFEVVREYLTEVSRPEMQKGAVFYDIHTNQPYRLDLFTAAIKDGRNNYVNRGVFVVQTDYHKQIIIKQPTIFLDLILTPNEGIDFIPINVDLRQLENVLLEKKLEPLKITIDIQRQKEISIILKHIEISLKTIIDKAQVQYANLYEQKQSGSAELGLDGRLSQAEDRLEELNNRLERRRDELTKEKQIFVSEIQHIGAAMVIPHPERESPTIASMVRDDEIERIAIQEAKRYEEKRGWIVESVENDNRGFDLISRKPHPDDLQTSVDVRFIEVKGRAKVDAVALSSNEYKTAERLKGEYWLYVVYNCCKQPELIPIQNPVRLGWKPIVKIEQYQIDSEKITGAK